jgi:hypothetical protein
MTYSDQSIFHKIKNEILARPQTKLPDLTQRLQIERHRIEKAVRVCKGTSFREYRGMLSARIAVNLLIGDSELPQYRHPISSIRTYTGALNQPQIGQQSQSAQKLRAILPGFAAMASGAGIRGLNERKMGIGKFT